MDHLCMQFFPRLVEKKLPYPKKCFSKQIVRLIVLMYTCRVKQAVRCKLFVAINFPIIKGNVFFGKETPEELELKVQ